MFFQRKKESCFSTFLSSSALSRHCFCALVYRSCMFQFRVLIRPHPAIWRLVHGMAVLYLVALTFLLFQVSQVFLFIFFCLLLVFVTLLMELKKNSAAIYYIKSFWFVLQKRDDARQFMKFLHPDLGVGNWTKNAISTFSLWNLICLILTMLEVELTISWHFSELPERSYGADCRIYLPDNPTSRFKNVYVRILPWKSFSFLNCFAERITL